MKQLNWQSLVVGVAIGAGALLAMGGVHALDLGVDASKEPSESVREVDLPRRAEGLIYMKDETMVADPRADIENLPVLVEADKSEAKRFEVVDLGKERGFILLDTKTGLARQFTPSNRVLIYNPKVPTHVVSAEVRVDSFPLRRD
mgnify:CR=1 FL=1